MNEQLIIKEVTANVMSALGTGKEEAQGGLPYPTAGLSKREIQSFESRHHGDVEARESLIASAITARKFPADRADHYRAMYDSDPAGAEAAITAMASVTRDPAPAPAQSSAPVPDDEYPREWLKPSDIRQPGTVIEAND